MKHARWILVVLLILGMASMIGCQKKKKAEAKNIDQIQKEQGVPVRTENVVPHMFASELTYNATITGLLQTSEYSKVGGRVDRVNVKVGDRVEKGQVLVEFPRDLPSIQYDAVVASYNLAKATYDRMKNLEAKGGISRQDLDGAETNLKAAETRLDAANQMLKVRAPMSGIVTDVTVKESDNVRADDLLFTISKLDRMKATVWVDDTEIGEIHKGMDVICTWNNQETHGRVSAVAMAMDPTRQAFAVDVEITNSGAALKAGVLAEISLRTYINPKAFVVARKATRTDSQGTYVFTNDNGTAKKVYIQTGKTNALDLEVTGGLTEGMQVVTEGLDMLSDGAKLKIIE